MRNTVTSRRPKGLVLAAAAGVLLLLLLGCIMPSQPVYDRLEAEPAGMGLVAHTGGAAVDIAAVPSLETTADYPRAWVATPYSVRTIAAGWPLSVGGFENGMSLGIAQSAEWMTSQEGGRLNKAIAVDAASLVAAVVSDKGLEVLAGPSQVGRLEGLVAGNDVAFLHGTVYIADGLAGMRVVDADDALAPVLCSTVDPVPGAPALSVAVPEWNPEVPTTTVPPVDPRVLLAENGTVYLYDCSVRTAPVLRASVSVPGVRAIATCVQDGVLFVYATTPTHLRVYRVEAADTFVELGAVAVPGELGRVSACGDHVWIALGPGGSATVNVTTPTAPVYVASYPTSDTVGGVVALRDRVLTAAGADGTQMHYASDHATGESMGGKVALDVADVFFEPMNDGCIAPTVYVLDREQGVHVYGFCGPPAPPEFLDFFSPAIGITAPAGFTPADYEPAAPGMTMMSRAGIDPTLFVTAGGDKIQLWSGIGWGENYVQTVTPAATLPDTVRDMTWTGPVLCAALGSHGMHALIPSLGSGGEGAMKDVATFDAPSPVVSVAATRSPYGAYQRAEFVFAGTQDGTLYSIDTSPPLTDPYVYSIGETTTLIPPVTLTATDSILLASAPATLGFAGPYLAAVMGDAGVAVLDVSDPANMSQLCVIPVRGVAAAGTTETLYITTGDGVEAWDITTPTAPVRAGGYRGIETGPLAIFPDLGMPLVASGPRGLTMFTDARRLPPVAEVRSVGDGEAYFGPAFPWAMSEVDSSTVVGASLSHVLWKRSWITYSAPGTQTAILKPRVAYSWEATEPGRYRVRAHAADIAGNATTATAEFRIITNERIGGADRFGTAAAASERAFPSGATTAVIACGSTPVDALVAAPLAHALGAPVLLTAGRLPTSTAVELGRLGVSDVIVVGGTGAVPAAVVSDLASAGIAPERVRRIAGSDRYDTARLVATSLRAVRARDPRRVYVVGADAYPDMALAAGPAARESAPIVVVGRYVVPAASRAVLTAFAPTSTIVVGGTGRVSDALSLPAVVTRVAGATRYDTALQMGGWLRSRGIESTYTFLANGAMPFGAGSAPELCARAGAPLLFSESTISPQTEAFLVANKRSIVHLRSLGGTAAVGSDAESQALVAIGLAEPGPSIPTTQPPVELDPLVEYLFNSIYVFFETSAELTGDTAWSEMGQAWGPDGFWRNAWDEADRARLLQGAALQPDATTGSAAPPRAFGPTREEVEGSLTPGQRAQLEWYRDPPPAKAITLTPPPPR